MQRERQEQKLAGRFIDLDDINEEQIRKAKAAMEREDREAAGREKQEQASRRSNLNVVIQDNLVSHCCLDWIFSKYSEDLMSCTIYRRDPSADLTAFTGTQ